MASVVSLALLKIPTIVRLFAESEFKAGMSFSTTFVVPPPASIWSEKGMMCAGTFPGQPSLRLAASLRTTLLRTALRSFTITCQMKHHAGRTGQDAVSEWGASEQGK
jgi:hypothetical protein